MEEIKNLNVKIYVPISAKHTKSKEGIERIMSYFILGRAKATWCSQEIDRRHIVKAILQGTTKSEYCEYYALGDEKYNVMQEGYVPKHRKHSSTTYD